MKVTRRAALKTGLLATGAAALSNPLCSFGEPSSAGRRESLLDAGWMFAQGHLSDPARDFNFGALGKHGVFAKADKLLAVADTAFDDSTWLPVHLPHDWAVALPFTDDFSTSAHGWKPIGRIYPETSVGWYRRHLPIEPSDKGRRLTVTFEGVMRDASFFLNGYYLGRSQSGYIPFSLDISDYCSYDGPNVLVVRVDASQQEGWFYEGAGIYRHVWLTSTDLTHLCRDGVFIQYALTQGAAVLNISAEVRCEAAAGNVRVRHRILTPAGTEAASAFSAATALTPSGTKTLPAQLTLRNPAVWSLESPNLYTCETSLLNVTGRVLDTLTTSFGLRTVRFDPEQGFMLNGIRTPIQGTCNHQDHAGIGAAVPDWLWTYRTQLLKEIGCNAHRIHHMNAAPLMDACDCMGMLVLAETRWESSSPEGLAQLEAMIRRDRNRPSVFAWSLANEEPEQGTERGARILGSMKALANRLDPTRPVTAAMNGAFGKGFSGVVDIQGFNYELQDIDAFRRANPHQPCLGTEVASTFFTRGNYHDDPRRGLVNAYDLYKPKWGETAEEWMQFFDARPWLSGGFVWTGFDYRGEPVPFDHISVSSQFGILDTCGFRKDIAEYYRAQWTSEPMLHLLPHWNWAPGEQVSVWAYGNLREAELLLNGRSLGAKPIPRLGHAEWSVPFVPGVLELRGRTPDSKTITSRRQTAGPAHALTLTSSQQRLKADGEDGCQLIVVVVDAHGIAVPTANNAVRFQIEDSSLATVLGTGNGDPNSREPDTADTRLAFRGRCAAIIRTRRKPGRLLVTVSSEGLQPATAMVEVLFSASRLA